MIGTPAVHAGRVCRPQRFVEAFFPNIGELQKPPHHPKWREVNLAATLPGWTRFEAAQQWLDSQPGQTQRNIPNNSGAPADQTAATDGVRSASSTEQLFQEFLMWRHPTR